VSNARKTIVRFNTWVHPDFLSRFEREADIDLVVSEQDDDAGTWETMARAHAYQVQSSRDELKPHWHISPEFLARTPNMLCISTGGAGYDTVDVPACTAAGVLVVNQAGGNAVSVAEHTIGMMLDLSKRITETDRAMRARPRGFPREDLMGHEITGRTIGIVGIGHVGTRVARFAKAFDMTVLATDPYVDAETVAARGAQKVELDELLSRSDFVSLHCPRDSSTMRMLDAAAYAKMKQGAMLITTCRGGVHDEAALLDALLSGHLGGAGLDVWDKEPPPLDYPLLALENVVSTFHTAGVTHEARGQMARFASDQLVEVLAGKYPPRPVNPEVWPQYAKRFADILGFAPAAAPA
jgi:D-3-phosphoglycerate dehydrogenase